MWFVGKRLVDNEDEVFVRDLLSASIFVGTMLYRVLFSRAFPECIF